ncbi:MAG: hypothetical protein EOP53_14890 [Sphingobacteriales bacterium]|nr:MAG: hypothetical protein EOP53_14890 [Sphingobacteriales bacterium]
MKIRNIMAALSFAFLCVFATACNNNKNDVNVAQMISGASSKTWHPVRETNASGDKEKLDANEKRESWVFYSNGQVSMNMTSQAIQGTWNYDPNTKLMSITPSGSTMAQTFTVVDADEDDLHLKAGDGSEMKLETRD